MCGAQQAEKGGALGKVGDGGELFAIQPLDLQYKRPLQDVLPKPEELIWAISSEFHGNSRQQSAKGIRSASTPEGKCACMLALWAPHLTRPPSNT
jgi:hypothetical protein